MSDIENLDVLLGNFQGNDQVRDEIISEAAFDLDSSRQHGGSNLVEGNFRPLLNTSFLSEKSGSTAETSRAIYSEISSKMSIKLEEMKSDLNSHILDVINSAIKEKVIPSIKKAEGGKNSAKNTNLDLRSDGLDPNSFSQVRP